MTSTPYQAYPDFPAGTPPQPLRPLPVELAVAGAARQRRATVAFRLILIIPHVFVLFFLAIAAWVVAFLGWWGALFTGYLPVFATAPGERCLAPLPDPAGLLPAPAHARLP